MKNNSTKFFARVAMIAILGLTAIVRFASAAENDTHDMGVSFSKLLNNNASIDPVNISAQAYPVKAVTINWRYNKTTANVVTIEVSVGGNSWGTKSVGTNTTDDVVFEGAATTGAINITFTNNAGSGTGKGTFYVNSVTLTEGSSGGASSVATPVISGTTPFYPSTSATISCATDGASIYYTTNGATPTSSSTAYTSAISINETTTVKAIAIKDGMTDSDVASKTFTKATPYANIAALTAQTEAGTYYVTLSNAVVTYVNGNYAYIQDASGAVAMFKSGHGLSAGQTLTGTATVTYQLRNNNPQITAISGITPVSGAAPDPVEVAASSWGYTFGNVLSQYFRITGATLTETNSKYYVSLNGDDVQLYKAGGSISSLNTTRTYTIVGFPTLYNTTKELQIFADPEVEATPDPVINISPNSLSGFTYGQGSGPSLAKTLTVSGDNLTANISIALGESNYEMSLSEDSGYTNSLSLTQSAGSVSSTTIYVRLKSGLLTGNYDGSISLSSTNATTQNVALTGTVTAPDVTSLPFSYNLGRDGIALAAGLSYDGLGTDYASSPKLKFDSASDYLILHFNEAPGDLSFDIKGNGSGSDPWAGTFKVQSSVNGSAYSDVEEYTTLSSSTTTKTIDNLAADVRYIKWIYVTKTTGNVALGNIELAKVDNSATITPSSYLIDATASETSGTLTVSYNNVETGVGIDIVWYESNGTVVTSAPAWVDADINNVSFDVDYMIGENTGDARSAYFKIYGVDGEANDVYSDLITISQAAYVAPPAGDQYALFSGELVEGDYIIYYDGSAMNSTVTSERLQYESVTPINNVIYTSDPSIVWHIAKSGEYWTIYNSNADAYAAGTGVKNKAQLLDSVVDQSLWTLSGEYDFINKANNEASVNAYLRNNKTVSQNYGFACYASGTGGELSLYKRSNEPASIELTAVKNGDFYWATFYNSAARYDLPEGAQAFTMNEDHELYRLGTDGSVIPANTAVIIISDEASITLTKSNDATAITVNGGANILRGSNYSITKTGTPYVLGIIGGVLGYYEFDGSSIPANKAYYK